MVSLRAVLWRSSLPACEEIASSQRTLLATTRPFGCGMNSALWTRGIQYRICDPSRNGDRSAAQDRTDDRHRERIIVKYGNCDCLTPAGFRVCAEPTRCAIIQCVIWYARAGGVYGDFAWISEIDRR